MTSEEFKVRKSPVKVGFDSVEIITFPVKLGDNPAVSDGAPLTIGWTPTDRTKVDVSVYEFTRQEQRRRGKKLMIPAVEREVMLLTLGYKLNRILEASDATDKARKERIRSIQNKKKWDRFATVLGRFSKALSINSSNNGNTKSSRLLGKEEQRTVSAITA